MYIGVISDTHGVYDKQFGDFLSPVDEIWHAGDWGLGEDFAHSLAAGKALVGVHGNCDGTEIRGLYPEYQFFERDSLGILLTHIGGSPGHYYPSARALIEKYRPDVFVCGHSHILKVMHDDRYNMLYINPGAVGIQGWHLVRTALRFHIREGKICDMEVFELERGKRNNV